MFISSGVGLLTMWVLLQVHPARSLIWSMSDQLWDLSRRLGRFSAFGDGGSDLGREVSGDSGDWESGVLGCLIGDNFVLVVVSCCWFAIVFCEESWDTGRGSKSSISPSNSGGEYMLDAPDKGTVVRH
jgi:hypothetical protein